MEEIRATTAGESRARGWGEGAGGMLPGIGEEPEASVGTRVTWMLLCPGHWVSQARFVCLSWAGG